jgi:hypothetical protein
MPRTSNVSAMITALKIVFLCSCFMSFPREVRANRVAVPWHGDLNITRVQRTLLGVFGGGSRVERGSRKDVYRRPATANDLAGQNEPTVVKLDVRS